MYLSRFNNLSSTYDRSACKHKAYLNLLALTKADRFGFMDLSCKQYVLLEPLIIIAGLYECG